MASLKDAEPVGSDVAYSRLAEEIERKERFCSIMPELYSLEQRQQDKKKLAEIARGCGMLYIATGLYNELGDKANVRELAIEFERQGEMYEAFRNYEILGDAQNMLETLPLLERSNEPRDLLRFCANSILRPFRDKIGSAHQRWVYNDMCDINRLGPEEVLLASETFKGHDIGVIVAKGAMARGWGSGSGRNFISRHFTLSAVEYSSTLILIFWMTPSCKRRHRP